MTQQLVNGPAGAGSQTRTVPAAIRNQTPPLQQQQQQRLQLLRQQQNMMPQTSGIMTQVGNIADG